MQLKKVLTREEILQHLPHRPPFLFVDKVSDVVEGEFIKASKYIKNDEEYFKGHFPSNPVMPGVLIIEAMAQVSCILFDLSLPSNKRRSYWLGSVKVRFLSPVSPGCTLEIFSRSVKMISAGGIFEVQAKVVDVVVASGEMSFSCQLQ